jgi:ketosteroid isomerase-like protein
VNLSPTTWIDAYRDAWLTADSDAVTRLFAEDGVYCWNLLRPPAVGREAIRRYWDGETARQSEVDVRFGEPVVAGAGRVAVEFWTKMKEHGTDVTLHGCMMLRFDADGRCAELREYWLSEPGRHEPPDFWGV